ncbi:hypothetical protein ACFFJY_19255 [Fictibacillus aquaticus]|uniref:Uncharacterized protein n=1 Tax=Fictibacillus aquaticus TaxID=2021314 RepID=A0A235F4X0_9BACL|nr:hypothetical protein [Fictibacillus aquaticus]OYD56282.1 hypothetical protein CGZ90_18195 [Fictibacillus aquaticus]
MSEENKLKVMVVLVFLLLMVSVLYFFPFQQNHGDANKLNTADFLKGPNRDKAQYEPGMGRT